MKLSLVSKTIDFLCLCGCNVQCVRDRHGHRYCIYRHVPMMWWCLPTVYFFLVLLVSPWSHILTVHWRLAAAIEQSWTFLLEKKKALLYKPYEFLLREVLKSNCGQSVFYLLLKVLYGECLSESSHIPSSGHGPISRDVAASKEITCWEAAISKGWGRLEFVPPDNAQYASHTVQVKVIQSPLLICICSSDLITIQQDLNDPKVV